MYSYSYGGYRNRGRTNNSNSNSRSNSRYGYTGGSYSSGGGRYFYYYPSGGRNSYRDPYSGTNYFIYTNSDSGSNGYDNVDSGNTDYGGRTTRSDEPTTTPDFSTTLTVKSVDLMVKENGREHHTDSYEISASWQRKPKLVVRRGQPFTVSLQLSREYDEAEDDLKLVFEAGDYPSTTNGTYVDFILSDEDHPKEWGAKIISKEDTQLTVQIFTPPTLYIGQWDFSVEVVKKSDTSVDVYKYEHDDPIYVIFNPWCKDDAVNMEDNYGLKEYVLNDTGSIFQGSKESISEKPWNFGQFDSVVLDSAMYLLSALKWEVRGNPINITRKLSALVNSNDDGGVLVGNWSGDYSGGQSPLSWAGSTKIFEEFWRTKRPVKYAQCWVYSGVMTTICRTLGIPCRSITNYVSAHDTDGSVTIDSVYDSEGNKTSVSKDSVWNFHVWNEVWMERNDLPEGYGGWQAIDATPQETSDGVFCCGPASVRAAREGNINMPYDLAFVFAEVNADRIAWQINRYGKLDCVAVEKNEIGKNMSTKAANGNHREDVTHQYKHQEGSAEEREAVLRANQTGSNRPNLYDRVPGGGEDKINFEIEQDSQNTWVGEDFEVTLRMRNGSGDARTIRGQLVVSSMFYTGEVAHTLKAETIRDITIESGEEKTVVVNVSYEEYDGKLKDGCMLELSAFAEVLETGQRFSAKPAFRLRKPHLNLQVPSQAYRGQEFQAEVSFSNPLATTLTNCYLEVDGLTRPLRYRLSNVSPKGTLLTNLPVIPNKVGEATLIVVFNSDQLEDVNGSAKIYVQDM